MTDHVATVPFPGFYCSIYSAELDHNEEREAERISEDRGISEREAADILLDITDHAAAYLEVAKDYVEVFNNYLTKHMGWNLGVTFESLQSPREYNFTTDRIFVNVSVETIQRLMDGANRPTLAGVIRERFTSRDGFISFYTTDLAEWLAKPIAEWDHNELGTLIFATVEEHLPEDWEFKVFSKLVDKETFFTAINSAVDWAKLDERLAELEEESET